MLAGYETFDVTVTTDGSQEGAALSAPMTGRLIQVEYIAHATEAFASNATFVLEAVRSDGASAVQIFESVAGQIDEHASFLPGFPTLDEGGAETGASDFYTLVNEQVRVTIANGGDTKTGTFRFKVAK